MIDLTPNVWAMMNFALTKLTFSKKKMVLMFASIKKERVAGLVGLLKEGKIKTVIYSKYRLIEAQDAWAKSIDGHATGKIIVEP